MNLVTILLYSWFTSVYGELDNSFIIDYFNYKRASSVIGFSCNLIEDDFLLFRSFSERGIVATLNKLENVTQIHLLGNANYRKIGIFLDIRCYTEDSIASVLFEASSRGMFDELRHWLILGHDLEDVLHLTDDRAFGISTDFVIAVATPDVDEDYSLYDAYNIFKDRGGILNVTFLGNWNGNFGLSIRLEQDKFQRRSNLHRLSLKAVYFKLAYRPQGALLEDYLNDYSHPTRDALAKFGYNILSHLADLHNFTLVSLESEEWKPGDALGPVARSLANNSADLVGSPITMNVPRTYLFKYVHQDWPFRTCFIFRNPQPTNIKVKEVLQPFTNDVWYSIFIFIVFKIVILVAFLDFEGIDAITVRFLNSFLIIIGALCQQSTDVRMNQLSTRIMFLFLMIFSILVYNYYSACVVSARLDNSIFKINDSLVEFGKLRLKMSSEWMVYLEFFLKKTDWDTKEFYHNYWLKSPDAQKFMLPEPAMQLVRKGGFAYHSHPDVIYPYIEKSYDNQEICELMEVHLARPVYTTFGVTKNSTIEEIVRVGLTKITEVGLRFRQVTRWQFRKPHCRTDILSASSINIYEFSPHLLLLVIGISLSVIIYVFEMLITYYSNNVKIDSTSKRRNSLFASNYV